jgi:hypothetical protein
MTFAVLNLIFPIVLAIHNIDEYSRYDDFVRAFHPRLIKKLTTRRAVRNAAVLLTLAVALLDAMTYVYKAAVLTMISKVSICALMLNGIGHCILSLRRRTLLPGTLSAATLVLPYSVIAIAIMRADFGDSFWSFLRLAAFGALTAPLAIISFLWIGYGTARLSARNEK